MARENYAAQVALLVRILPYVAKEEIFTLQGGTAINLFYRDLPRLSVDIDLTYLPLTDRAESLVEINDAMDRIAAAIEGGITGAKAQRIAGGGGGARARLHAWAQPKSRSKPPPLPGASCMIRNNVKSPKPSRRSSDMRR
jgi:hypothetical protein